MIIQGAGILHKEGIVQAVVDVEPGQAWVQSV